MWMNYLWLQNGHHHIASPLLLTLTWTKKEGKKACVCPQHSLRCGHQDKRDQGKKPENKREKTSISILENWVVCRWPSSNSQLCVWHLVYHTDANHQCVCVCMWESEDHVSWSQNFALHRSIAAWKFMSFFLVLPLFGLLSVQVRREREWRVWAINKPRAQSKHTHKLLCRQDYEDDGTYAHEPRRMDWEEDKERWRKKPLTQ